MTEGVNRQFLLAARPVGMVKESDFEYAEAPIPEPGEGEFLAQTLIVGVEPAMRGHMLEQSAYTTPIQLGEVMRATGVARVVKSNNPDYEVGDLVQCQTGFQDYVVAGGKNSMAAKLPEGVSPEAALSIFGGTGFTAYYGITEIGEVKEGDTVLVSGAAGAVGNIVCQIARIKGAARVVGIAGSEDKCRWLVDEIGADAAINYKTDNVKERIAELFPDGIDVFFDNVGGQILDDALANLAINARVVICGGISRYNADHAVPGPENYFNLVYKRARMEGFIIIDNMHRAKEFTDAMAPWIAEGKLKFNVDVLEGFENLPRGLIRLFTGENIGKQLIRINQ